MTDSQGGNMTCDCKHSQDGRCRRFPPVRTVENGRNVWQFPPADAECGERVRAAEPAEGGEVTAKEAKPPAKRTRTAAKSKSKAVTNEG